MLYARSMLLYVGASNEPSTIGSMLYVIYGTIHVYAWVFHHEFEFVNFSQLITPFLYV